MRRIIIATSTTSNSTDRFRALLVALLLLGAAWAAGLLILTTTARPAHAATTFVVNSAGDSPDSDTTDNKCFTGAFILVSVEECTLRAAIQQANATAGADTIAFDIPIIDISCDVTSKVCTISPASGLPPITEAVTINGYTQPGASPNTQAQGTNAVLLVELDGTKAPGNDLLDIRSSGSVIRGLVINRARNVRGEGHGISVCCGTSATGNFIEGNFIGTDPSGTQDKGNEQSGILLFTANNTVGGTTPDKRNLISGNDSVGVLILAANNKIEGNYIGTNANGTAALDNSRGGVHVERSGNTIGGTTSGAANVIAFNGGNGVAVYSGIADSTGNSILSNSIYANGKLGINLIGGTEDANGKTTNDLGTPPDADTGANNLQNFPEITSAKPTKKHKKKLTTIKGNLVSTPSTTFTVQFFSNPLNDTSEGKTFIGQLTNVTTDENGVAVFSKSVARKKAPLGSAITATATDPNGNTSEFSDPRSVG